MKLLEHWLPEDHFGRAVACLATSFTFDSDFFTDDCLGRFLSITARDPDGATGLDVAGMLEEEEKLAEATVCVLVDQSCRPQPRNLRWDLVPVRVPGGLLHAKVAVLIWENAMRVIIGSANLTRAGYREQVELAVAFDLDEKCQVPRSVFQELATELRGLLTLTPGDPNGPGPKARAESLLDMFERRLATARLPERPPSGFKVALAPGRSGSNPLDVLAQVWSGSPAQSVVALSPFWDDKEEMLGASALVGKGRLAARASAGGQTRATFVVPVDARPGGTVVRAPRRLQSVVPTRIDSSVVAFANTDGRRVHAKCVQYRSDSWIATMFGSSNITAKGLGIDSSPHRELNLWIGCSTDSAAGKALAKLIPFGDTLTGGEEWEVSDDDEDDTTLDPLPAGFGEALITGRSSVSLGFTGSRLPNDWRVEVQQPGSQAALLLDASAWAAQGTPSVVTVRLPEGDTQLPAALDVHWDHNGAAHSAAWLVNVGDSSFLPPPAELREMSAETLLAILASTRPLREAFIEATRKQAHTANNKDSELDPLKRFDSSGFLLQRTRRSSAALWGIERRLAQRINSLDALEWRLAGTLGPEHVAAKLVEAAQQPGALAGEAAFVLAELALTVRRIRWHEVSGEVPLDAVRARVARTIDTIREVAAGLPAAGLDPSLRDYVASVMAEVAS